MLFPVCRPSASFLSSGDAHFLKHPLECGAGDPFRFLTTLAENMVQLFIGNLANLLLDGQQEFNRYFCELRFQLSVALPLKMPLNLLRWLASDQMIDRQQIRDCCSRILKTTFCSLIGYRALELALNSVCVIQQHHAAIGIIV